MGVTGTFSRFVKNLRETDGQKSAIPPFLRETGSVFDRDNREYFGRYQGI
jgi:hypothetical protein